MPRNLFKKNVMERVIMSENRADSMFWQGQTFELETEDKEIYYTQLIMEEDELIIQRPINRKRVLLTITGNVSVKVSFHDTEKQGLFTFNSVVTMNTHNRVFLKCPLPEELKMAQRRSMFRVQTGVEIRLGLPSEQNPNHLLYFKLYTQDLSGGGLSFLNKRRIVESGEHVEGSLYLRYGQDYEEVKFQGRVIGTTPTGNQTFRTSLEFQEMTESIQAYIIKFCMFKQIELAKLSN